MQYDRLGNKVKKEPYFPINGWSKFKPVSEASCLDNNRAESFNRQFQDGLNARGNFWKLILHLSDEDSMARVKIMKSRDGSEANHFQNKRSRRIVARRKELQNYVKNYYNTPNKGVYLNSLLPFYGEHRFLIE